MQTVISRIGLPWWLSGKESACQCRRWGFNLWSRKISWRRKWQPTPVFLPREIHGQRSLADCSLWGCNELDTTEQLNWTKLNHRSGLSWWLSGKESTWQCRRIRFDTWIMKIPWRRKWQPTPVFLPEQSHGQRSLADCSLWGSKRVRHNLVTKQQHSLLFP